MGLVKDRVLVERLVTAHSDKLYRYAYWLSRDKTVAEDLVQETFLRAFEKSAQLKDQAQAYGWLSTILKRIFLRSLPQIPIETDDDLLDLVDVNQCDFGPDEALSLRQALVQLPLCYREPLVLQVIEGLSLEEIGVRLGVAPKTVATRLFRARRKLRTLITEQLAHNIRVGGTK